jgi:hypothetical protein
MRISSSERRCQRWRLAVQANGNLLAAGDFGQSMYDPAAILIYTGDSRFISSTTVDASPGVDTLLKCALNL